MAEEKKSATRCFVMTVFLSFFLGVFLVWVSFGVFRISPLKHELESKSHENIVLQERVDEWRPLVMQLEKVRDISREKILSIKGTFGEIKTYVDLLHYIAENPDVISKALNQFMSINHDDREIYDMGRIFIGDFREVTLGERYSFDICPDHICPGDDEELIAEYVALDKDMGYLGRMMRDQLPELLTSPQELRARLLLIIDPILVFVSNAEKERLLSFVKMIYEKYYAQVGYMKFKSDLEEYNEFERVAFDGFMMQEKSEEDRIAFLEEFKKKHDEITVYWNMSIADMQLACDYFAVNREEWRRLFNLLERKLR